ncbi:MAG: ATP-binding protein [Acidimicrobiia bacterium]|nr:ATP-binding protein [Acidimicrobiia bacterium]
MATSLDLEGIFVRIAAGARVVGAAWVGILVVVAYLVSRDAMDRPWLPIISAVVAGAWSMVSVGWAVNYPQRVTSIGAIATDVVVGAGVLVASAVTGSGTVTYAGGLPFIVVAVAAIRGLRPAWFAASAMTAVTLLIRPWGLGDAIGSIVLYAAGAATFTWVISTLRDSDRLRRVAEERRLTAEAAAARASERVEISRHLHDSVLQTLALIQRRADSPAEVTVLARRQERELRDWLFGENPVEGSFGSALRAAAAAVEERHAVPIDVVTTGDRDLDDALAALVAAAGEAMTNAALHSGADMVSVFAEVGAPGCVIFVRDRGSGFDLASVPDDRMGVRQSIVGRVEAHGGTAHLRSEPGWGTEWKLETTR